MKVQNISAVCVLLLVFSWISCSENNSSSGSQDDDSATSQDDGSPSSQDDASAAPQDEEPMGTLPGLAGFTGEMLRRGAGERNTEQIAETIESVGGDLSIETNTDYTSIEIRVLREHIGLAMELLSDVARRPTFPEEEIEKLRRMELDRLSYMKSQPRWLARQAFYRHLYGESHPYGYYDAEPQTIKTLTRNNLLSFHKTNFVPRNSLLIVVGDVGAEDVTKASKQHFGSWEDRPAPQHKIPVPQKRESRQVLVVNVPGTTQANLYIGNGALRRSDPNYLKLRVANQVFGGSASARLFMNLREKCSYSYGIYSGVSTLLGQAPLTISGAVESAHTAGALREIFAETQSITNQVAPEDELDAAQAYMVGHFPIITETAGNLSRLVTIQRVYGLSDDYWSTYRTKIAEVTAEQALEAAKQYIQPDQFLMVIVGDASKVAEPARRYGEVKVVSLEGEEVEVLPAMPDQWPGGEPDPCPELAQRDAQSRPEQPPQPTEARDMEFPDVVESSLDNGLQVLTIERRQLPLVYVRLVVRSGSASDPL